MSQDPKPVVSVFCSAARPECWLKLHENLSTSEVPFEMVFVGNKKPKFILPSNFHFIYSNVKPSQCFYIAAKHCKGEYLCSVNDDFCFSNKALDLLLEAHSDDLFITSPYYKNNMSQTINGRPDFPPIAIGFLISRNLWNTMSIDNNFIAQFWDFDIFMSLPQLGGKINIVSNVSIKEKQSPNLCLNRHGFKDKEFLYNMWYDNITWDKHGHMVKGDLLPERRSSVQPFCWTEDVLTVSQGKTNARWD